MKELGYSLPTLQAHVVPSSRSHDVTSPARDFDPKRMSRHFLEPVQSNNSCGIGVKPQPATETFFAAHSISGTALICRCVREYEDVALTLVIFLAMKMVDEIRQRAAERS